MGRLPGGLGLGFRWSERLAVNRRRLLIRHSSERHRGGALSWFVQVCRRFRPETGGRLVHLCPPEDTSRLLRHREKPPGSHLFAHALIPFRSPPFDHRHRRRPRDRPDRRRGRDDRCGLCRPGRDARRSGRVGTCTGDGRPGRDHRAVPHGGARDGVERTARGDRGRRRERDRPGRRCRERRRGRREEGGEGGRQGQGREDDRHDDARGAARRPRDRRRPAHAARSGERRDGRRRHGEGREGDRVALEASRRG